MKVIYPGSFDPITNGHLDIFNKIANIYSLGTNISVLVMNSDTKKPHGQVIIVRGLRNNTDFDYEMMYEAFTTNEVVITILIGCIQMQMITKEGTLDVQKMQGWA